MRPAHVLVFAAFAAAVVIVNPFHLHAQAPAASISPLVSWSGSFSAIKQQQIVRVTDETDWATLWMRHQGERLEKDCYSEAVVPAIDFDRFMVVAVFDGESTNLRRETLEACEDMGDHIRMRCMRWSFQTASLEPLKVQIREGETPQQAADRAAREMKDDGGAQHTTPYGIFVLPRSDKPIVLEEPVPSKRSPLQWRERTRLEPPAK